MWASPTPSRGGYFYYVSFINAYTRHTWIYMLKSKVDAFHTFKLFQSYVKTNFNAHLKAIQLDFGVEFRPFTRYLNELGIMHKLPCPHTSSSKWDSWEKAYANYGNGPHFVGPCFLTNWILGPRIYNNNVPNQHATYINFISVFLTFFALQNKLSEYKVLKVFGCACYPHLRPYNQNKLEFKISKCVFLRFSPTQKGYKCMDKNGIIFISRDVVFNEAEFPYPDLQSESHKLPLNQNQHHSSLPLNLCSSP